MIAATATEMPRGTAVRDETVGRHVPMHRATQDRSPQHHGPIKGSVPSRRLEMNSPASKRRALTRRHGLSPPHDPNKRRAAINPREAMANDPATNAVNAAGVVDGAADVVVAMAARAR